MAQKNTIFILLLVSIFFLFSCERKKEEHKAPSKESSNIKAQVDIAKITKNPSVYEAVGTIQAQTASTLSSKIMGIVQSIKVSEGNIVKKGELLAVITSDQIKEGLAQAEANVAEAKKSKEAYISAQKAAAANASLSRSTYERYKTLIKEHSITKQEFEEVEAKYYSAEAALKQAEAMVEALSSKIKQSEASVQIAKANQKDTEIYAPYDGIVTSKLIEEGSLANPGTPILTIERERLYRGEFIIPENYINSIKLNQNLKVTISALQTDQIEGTVQTIVPLSDVKSRSFLIKLSLPYINNLRSGMFARVELPTGEDKMLLIPSNAVSTQGQLSGIYVVDDNNIAHFRLIRTGKNIGGFIEVISGLNEGEKFVPQILPGLTDGSSLEVVK
ncbi:MAG: efflux RND transporter periplasmic adaptor subunit [Desulfobacterales bacterium]|nr:efflux RND transporter periplasmic adaptor subunit [Desulfobacterales bacterium]